MAIAGLLAGATAISALALTGPEQPVVGAENGCGGADGCGASGGEAPQEGGVEVEP